eukprot:6213262-Pleurochrysis_carterae.AAC.1
MSAMYVFRARMVLRVVCKINGRFVIEMPRCRVLGVFAEFVEQRAQVRGLLGGLGSCNDLGFAGRERH